MHAHLCRQGQIYVHQRSPRKSMNPSKYDMLVGGLVLAGEPSIEAARYVPKSAFAYSGCTKINCTPTRGARSETFARGCLCPRLGAHECTDAQTCQGVCRHVLTRLRTHVQVYASMYLIANLYVCMPPLIYMDIYVYVCVCVYIYIYIYIYIYT